MHQRLFFRHGYPVVEILFPGAQWLAPFRVGGHHVAGTVDVAAGIEAVVDDTSKRLEVVVVRLGRGVVEHERIVLVAARRLFVAAL